MERQGQMKKTENARQKSAGRHIGCFLGILLGVVCLFSACKRKEAVFTAGEALGQAESQENTSKDAEGQAEIPVGELAEAGTSGKAAESTGANIPADVSGPVKIVVYICGQVKAPGLYEMETGARIGDAIEQAGGMTDEAAKDALNLAQSLEDGQMIRIPSREEMQEAEKDLVIVSGGSGEGGAAGSQTGSAGGTGSGGLISLNRATKEELMTLPGIGESKAEAILRYRQERGGFGSIEEIMNISGIKEGVYLKIKDKITI